MAAPCFDFESTRKQYSETIKQCVKKQSVDDLKESFKDACASEIESNKSAVDQAFRDQLLSLICSDEEPQVFMELLNVATIAAQNDICSTASLFIMLSDLFDTISLNQCDIVFQFIEDRVSLWKQELFYNAGKNYLLRMCNDLLRRLSKSQNTVFCGRIQLFLARLFPLEEKSGLNLMSQFNVENVTVYNTKSDDQSVFKSTTDNKEMRMDVEEGELGTSIPVDYNLYRKFWSLQDFFRRPAQCYDKVAWKLFTNFADEVLSCFSSYKLDDVKMSRRKTEDRLTYFAKYLTSEKLLDLQLSDGNFRRYVLVQFLILFQYLGAQVRFKTPSQTLNDDQTTWIKEASERVTKILVETPPDGEQFTQAVKHILSREEDWNSWKNDGCPSFIRKTDPMRQLTSRKRCSMGDDLKASAFKVTKMGNSELTRLWNLCPDNMVACASHNRNFLPDLEEFFETAVEQSDPAGGIEEQYKLVKNLTFGWKALRLLARKSPHFFAQPPTGTGNLYKRVPDYLELMVSKMAKELPTSSSATANEVKPETDETTVTNGSADDNIDNVKDDETVKEDETGGDEEEQDDDVDVDSDERNSVKEDTESGRVSDKLLLDVATRLSDIEWKQLASNIHFQDDDIAYFESEHTTSEQRALKMLTVWKDNEGDKATVSLLKQSLLNLNHSKLVADLFV